MNQFGVQKAELKAVARVPQLPQPKMSAAASAARDTTPAKWLGVSVRNIADEGEMSAFGLPGVTGVLALEVPADSVLAKAGLRKNDVILSVNSATTTDAAALTEMGRQGGFGDVDVFGPLALDNALLKSAAEAKKIYNPVAGHADCMVVPSIEAGNLLGKAVKYLAGSRCAHVVVGAKVPILIPSRVESADDKVNAIALGVLYGRS